MALSNTTTKEKIRSLFGKYVLDDKYFQIVLIFVEIISFVGIFIVTNIFGFDKLLTEICAILILFIITVITVFLVLLLLKQCWQNISSHAEKVELEFDKHESYIKSSLDKHTEIITETKDYLFDQMNRTRDYIDNSKNHHITIINSSKELVLTMDPSVPGICSSIKHTMNIRNNGSQQFERYIYWISSSKSISDDLSEYKINTDSDSPFTKSVLQRQHFKTIYDDGREIDECKISIPVKIPPRKSKKLTIVEEQCPSFPDFNLCYNTGNSVDEWLTITINYPTEVLRFTVRIDEALTDYYFLKKNNYSIPKTKTMHPDAYITNKGCVILDQSEQSVQYELDALDRWGSIPEYQYGKNEEDGYKSITWEIHYPKIGYRYQLYFTLAKKC